jgi:enamine deaminase RidA (YjgF/YER057c/UK114 family)
MTIERIECGARMSQAVVHGNTVYLAGQVNKDVADVTGQTNAVLKQIDDLLAKTGSAKNRILSATIYLADIKTFAAMQHLPVLRLKPNWRHLNIWLKSK